MGRELKLEKGGAERTDASSWFINAFTRRTALHTTSPAGSRGNKTPLLLVGNLPLMGLAVSRKPTKSPTLYFPAK